jgi:hypothetical protein
VKKENNERLEEKKTRAIEGRIEKKFYEWKEIV